MANYLCDPRKNKECKKTVCYFQCFTTDNEVYSALDRLLTKEEKELSPIELRKLSTYKGEPVEGQETLYVCDPAKHTECSKYDCQNTCKHTTRKEFSIDGKGYFNKYIFGETVEEYQSRRSHGHETDL